MRLPDPPKSPAATREDQILDAAARAFATRGYDCTSMQEIAQSVGLSKPTLYHYFRSKEEICTRLSVRTLVALYHHVAPNTTTGNARTRITAFMTLHAQFFEQNYWAFIAMIVSLQPLILERHEQAVHWRDRYENHLRDLLREGIHNGQLRDTDPIMTGRAILSTLNWMIRWYRPDGPSTAEDIARTYADIILHGLEPRPPDSSRDTTTPNSTGRPGSTAPRPPIRKTEKH